MCTGIKYYPVRVTAYFEVTEILYGDRTIAFRKSIFFKLTLKRHPLKRIRYICCLYIFKILRTNRYYYRRIGTAGISS